MRKPASCHPSKFSKGKGLCGACYDKELKKTNEKYRQRQIQNTSRWKKLHPESRERYLQASKKRREENPELFRQRARTRLLKKYGLTIKSFEALMKKQKGACALCFRKEGKHRFHVDHHHKSGRVRGILCHQCNWYLGVIDADPSIILRIIKYLRPETRLDLPPGFDTINT